MHYSIAKNLGSSSRTKEKKNIFRGKFIWLRDMFFFDLRRSRNPVQPDGFDCVPSLLYYVDNQLLEVCHTWLKQLHVLLSVNVHCYGFATSFGMSHLAKNAAIRAGDFGPKRNLCLSLPRLSMQKRLKRVGANSFASKPFLFSDKDCASRRMDKQSIP